MHTLLIWLRQHPALLQFILWPINRLSFVRGMLRDWVERVSAPPPNINLPSLQEKLERPQLLIDVSDIIRFDPGTGIQRVVRNLSRELLRLDQQTWQIRLVYVWQGRYYYANSYKSSLLGDQEVSSVLANRAVSVSDGDFFLGLDWAQPMLRDAESQLHQWGTLGVMRSIVVYDLLPLQLPHYFPAGVAADTQAWMSRIYRCMDHIFTISASVAADVSQWQTRHVPQSTIGVTPFQLGADLDALRSAAVAPDANIVNAVKKRKTVLMVGTLDRRKGYTQALQAFEKLWQEQDVNLIIVGRLGAGMQRFVKRVRRLSKHRQKPVFWLPRAPDEELAWLYKNSSLLLAASEGEGFGLPLIEAVDHGLPVLARDLGVFKEVLGASASYFNQQASSRELCRAIRDALNRPSGHQTSAPAVAPLTWEDSAQKLFNAITSLSQSPVMRIKDQKEQRL